MERELKLTSEELETLYSILSQEADMVQEELHYTDKRDYRNRVKHERQIVEQLLQKTTEARMQPQT